MIFDLKLYYKYISEVVNMALEPKVFSVLYKLSEVVNIAKLSPTGRAPRKIFHRNILIFGAVCSLQTPEF